jgi:hypothetical protein
MCIAMLFLATSIQSQSLTLTREDKQIQFREGHLYEAVLSEYQDPDDDCNCRYSTVLGKIVSVDADSITFLANRIQHRNLTGDIQVENRLTYLNQKTHATFPREDLLYLKHFKSLKSKKTREGFTNVGGLLILTGIATSLSALAAPEKKSRQHVALAGGAQVGLGIVFAVVNGTKKYYIGNADPLWQIQSSQ